MDKKKLIAEIDEIAEFEYDWDSYGADPFADKTIDKTKVVINCLDDKYPEPDIIPNCVDMCLEWEHGENALEVYVGENLIFGGEERRKEREERVSYLKVVGKDMNDWTDTEISDLSEINELLEWLYGEKK
mgnify:CR=1 FL=1